MAEKVIHRLDDETGVELDGGNVTIYDTRAYSPRRLTVLTSEEMQTLIALYTGGCCPVCFEEISQGDVVCNEHLEEARNNRRLFGWSQ